jgi:hypothetical protein
LREQSFQHLAILLIDCVLASFRFAILFSIKGLFMIHHSCDRCKRIIDPDDELRYVVRIEIEAATPAFGGEAEEDRDHLMEVNEIIERAEDQLESPYEDAYLRKRFDLCGSCFRGYVKNPLNAENKVQLGFSQN